MSELGNTGYKRPSHSRKGIKDAFTESREQSGLEAANEMTLDLSAGSPVTGKSVPGIMKSVSG